MSGLTERLYLESPVWVQQGMVAAYGWWWNRRRFNKHFHRLTRELKAREHWTQEQFQSYQEKQLRKLLTAAESSPYYRRVFDEAGVDAQTPPFAALARLPFLTKETLRTRARDLLTLDPPPRDAVMFKSSGTSGTPTEIYYTPEFHALEAALAEARSNRWFGISYRDRRVMFGVRKVCRFDQNRPPFWRFNPAENMAYASIYHLSPEFLPHYVAFLRAYKPTVIIGYPSALNAVANYAVAHNDLPAPAKAVFTTSETLTDQMRQTIEAAWQSPIYDRYGAVEGCVLAGQCEHGRYHVSPEVGIIEILDRKGEHCPPGVLGEVICTGLQNTLQPLIRYRIGDAARWSSTQSCPCGRRLPILEAIEGRFEDICYTGDGRQMLRFDTVFKGVTNIKEAQVVQEDLNLFAVYVVPTEGFTQHDVEKIKGNMRLHVGDIQTQVNTVPAIARTQGGKFRAVICNLPAEQRERLRKASGYRASAAEDHPTSARGAERESSSNSG